MYDDLIAELRQYNNDGTEELRMQAADAIEDLSEQLDEETEYATALNSYLPQWIPVTERLPEIDEKHHCSKDVLAYLKGGGMCFTALEENIFGQSWFECERHPAIEEEMIVTHWMPLPEPPYHIREAKEMVEKGSEP